MNEFGSTMYAVPKDVKLQMEFNPNKYRVVYETRVLNKGDFNDTIDAAGEMGVGHTVTALYEGIPTGVKSSFKGLVDALEHQQEEQAKSFI